jgi:hypothetical protein
MPSGGVVVLFDYIIYDYIIYDYIIYWCYIIGLLICYKKKRKLVMNILLKTAVTTTAVALASAVEKNNSGPVEVTLGSNNSGPVAVTLGSNNSGNSGNSGSTTPTTQEPSGSSNSLGLGAHIALANDLFPPESEYKESLEELIQKLKECAVNPGACETETTTPTTTTTHTTLTSSTTPTSVTATQHKVSGASKPSIAIAAGLMVLLQTP